MRVPVGFGILVALAVTSPLNSDLFSPQPATEECEKRLQGFNSSFAEFLAEPDIEHTKIMMIFLECKLAYWDKYSNDQAGSIIETIGDRAIEPAFEYLLRFLRIDPEFPGADPLRVGAIIAVGKIRSPRSFDEIAGIVTSSQDVSLLSSGAVALGLLRDRRAADLLLVLAVHENDDIRQRSMSSLAEYCVAEPKGLVSPRLSEVRLIPGDLTPERG